MKTSLIREPLSSVHRTWFCELLPLPSNNSNSLQLLRAHDDESFPESVTSVKNPQHLLMNLTTIIITFAFIGKRKPCFLNQDVANLKAAVVLSNLPVLYAHPLRIEWFWMAF